MYFNADFNITDQSFTPSFGEVQHITDHSGEDALVGRTITSYANDRVTNVGAYAFYKYEALQNFDLPNVKKVGLYSFALCTGLKHVSLPELTAVAEFSFRQCSNLVSVDFPKVTSLETYAFYSCQALEEIILPSCDSFSTYALSHCRGLKIIDTSTALRSIVRISSSAFADCYSLKALVLRGEVFVAILSNVQAFNRCYHFYGTTNSTYNPNGLKDGYIYVPSALVEKYKAATNWSTFASQFRALEDYTVDGTVTGALDESKI